ncbi:MAG TPA: hypothetical protein VMW17_08180 [Candidatus Binatia bacterium]|nr:hypothetical protein [Candidatus Binatia bacterium]
MKFTAIGSIQLTAARSATVRLVDFEVRDTGSGIAPESAARD